MLFIRQIKHLACRLDLTVSELETLAEQSSRFCEQLLLLNPDKPDKARSVLNVKGQLRNVQNRLLRRVLLPALLPSDYSHGGIAGRHVKTNALPHINSKFAFTTDISNFYPSISNNRVYRLFVETTKCSPDVARILTKLCTHEHHLALGLVTSPILADQTFKPIDARIAAACVEANLIYSRFVDDITISGPFDLSGRSSGIANLVSRIIAEHGFTVQQRKHLFGRLDEGFCITKLRVNRSGKLDVRREYVAELERELADAHSLGQRGSFAGPYFTKSQIRGRVEFVGWINRARRKQLLSRFHNVDWPSAEGEAIARGLLSRKKMLLKVKL